MISKEQLKELRFGQTVYVCTGPGDFPQQGLCSYQGVITAKKETKFGFSIEITILEHLDENRIGTTSELFSISKVGEDTSIGAYIDA